MLIGKLCRHGGLDCRPNGGKSHRFWIGSLPVAAAIGIGVDANRAMVKGHGLWRRFIPRRRVARTARLFGDNRDFPRIVDALKIKGFSDDELGLIMGGNWVDLLTRVAQPAVESADIDADI